MPKVEMSRKITQEPLSKQAQLISELQLEAKNQAKLEKKKILPKQVDNFAYLIIRYPWQVLLIASVLTTLLVELVF
jgi:hypothetical protein